mgnify:CR=1 FL=1
MKYEVRLVGANFERKDKTILETENRTEAFEKMRYVRQHRHEEPFNYYDSVYVLENSDWIARFKLY